MKKLLLNILCTACVVWAGPNGSAQLYIDTDTGTSRIDSVNYCLKDSVFTVGVNADGLVNLYSYQMYLQYDTSKLQFISATAGSSNVLGLKGGQFNSFNGKSKDSTKIRLAGCLVGDDESQCATGSGLLAIVSFKMKSDDTAKLTLTDTMTFEDFDETVDNSLQTHQAVIIQGQSGVVFKKNHNKCINKINMANGRINIFLPDMSRSEITLVDIKGHVLAKRIEMSNKISLERIKVGAGMFILKVSQHGMTNAYPLLMK